MRLTLQQPQLLKSLQMVERAINDRSPLPILANILLETTANELILTATDLDVGVQYRVPLSQEVEQGSVTLPARRLATIVRELPDEAITLEAKKNHTTSLLCGGSRFRVQGLPAEDFPMLPPQEHASGVTIPQSTLKTLLIQTMFAMSLEETRFVLNGALLTVRDGTATLVATDGRRLARASGPVTNSGNDQGIGPVVIPAKTVRELCRLLQSDEPDPVTIAPLKDNQLLFHFGGATIITRLIEGQFPPHESVIPPPATTTLRCQRSPLASAIRRASLMTTATSQAVVFELSREGVSISKESSELGSAREELPGVYTGEPMTVAFNPDYWLDALKILDTEEVSIELTSPEKPAVIRLPEFLYLVLPMKLS